MAEDVIALLEYSNAWIDPNLRELVGTDGRAKKKQKRQPDEKKRQVNVKRIENGSQQTGYGADDGDWDDWQFANLNANRIVLKRAGHVSDASESESDEASST